jgi:tetratricopeptide (TPR) repeat protein
MEYSKITSSIEQLNSLVAQHQLSDLFKDLLRIIESEKQLLYLKDKVRKQAEIYNNLLRYSFTDIKDPERDNIYSQLLKSLYHIIDELKAGLVADNKFMAINTLQHETNFEFLSNRNKIEKGVLSDIPSLESNKLFRRIWVAGILNEDDCTLLSKAISNTKISWINESLIVSALTISNLMYFDEKKADYLFKFYYKGTDKVWQRALVGIVFNIYYYSDRLSEFPEISNHINSISKERDFYENLQSVVLQIIRTKETEKISRKLHEEIIPEVAKFKPKLEEKLRLDDILKESLGEDKNPDWEAVFEDSPELFSKLEEFSKLQIEGSDVFMSAFALLKHFDFFREPSHWFLPFYKENQDIQEAFQFEKEGFNSNLFLEGLEKSAFLCNSDKYSFIMNVRFMPEMQKNMMLEMFNAELESMNELIKDEEILKKSNLDKYIINQYIQDLYRFYKLYPNRAEFSDIFSNKLDLYNSKILNNNWFNLDLYKSIGTLYFKKEFYNETLEVYKILIDKGLNEQTAFEKIAYSYQKLGNFQEALLYYLKSELFETNLIWTTKKIALCYREIGQHQNALEYYLKAEANEPENLYVQAHLGHTYLRLKDFENAIKHYYKVEYFSPSNTMILRPIAWCSYVLGKFNNSLKYYNRLIEKGEASYYDYLNIGHVYWCSNQLEKATETYKQSIKLAAAEGKSIKKDFADDKEYLLLHGIQPFEIELMLDYLFLDINI